MRTEQISRTNFGHLEIHEPQLVRLGMLAERYFAEDPNTCLLKLRQFAEVLAQLTASKVGVFVSDEGQYDLLRRLADHGIVPREISQLFAEVRRAGNAASHSMAGDHRTTLTCLKISWQLGVWFHRTFKDASFRSGPFVPPRPPADESADLKSELARLRSELDHHRDSSTQVAGQLASAERRLREAEDERSFWEQMAAETEQAKAGLQQHLAALQAQAQGQSRSDLDKLVDTSTRAAQALTLDEADTRKLIDEQLRAAGWTADSARLSYGKCARPQKGQYLAIAEWPSASGPADYALFVGLMPIAVIEAKRKNIDVSAALQQAKRYSRDFHLAPEMESPGGPWGDFKIPFVFSANGRPYLRQLATRSGVWVCDVRRPDNLSQPLDGWYTPQGLIVLLKRDAEAAHEKLASEPLDYDLKLRPYQQTAIRAIEAGIAANRREMLVAMATGTGKTKTCIALVYRLTTASSSMNATAATCSTASSRTPSSASAVSMITSPSTAASWTISMRSRSASRPRPPCKPRRSSGHRSSLTATARP
jgi:type I restriction enzyme R subunit